MTVLQFQVALYKRQGADSPLNGMLVGLSAMCLQDVGADNFDSTTIVLVFR
jgi:hypothetical protein